MNERKPLSAPPDGKTWATTTADEARNGTPYLPVAWLDAHSDELEREALASIESGKDGPNASHLVYFRGRVGKPRKGSEIPMVQKSLRLPKVLWQTIEKQAQASGTTAHALAVASLMSAAARPAGK